jgi:tetratricopeptide (TPR) repeat protein
MNLSKLQLSVILGSFILLFSLIFMNWSGFTVPTTKKGETPKDEPKASLTEEIVLAQARNTLDSTQLVWLAELDRQKAQATTIDKEAEVLKLISRTWFENGNYLISGYYARKVAELVQTGTAWGIAGTTYGAAFNASQNPEEKKLAAQQSVLSLAKARELEPDTLQHAINEGLMYLELSTVDATVMPMKGVQMLQKLDTDFPDNVMVNMTLGRLSATRSGDMAKAKPRFEKVLAIAQKQPVADDILLEAHYFLVECYKQEGNKEQVLSHYENAIRLSASQPDMQAQITRAMQSYKKEIESK